IGIRLDPGANQVLYGALKSRWTGRFEKAFEKRQRSFVHEGPQLRGRMLFSTTVGTSEVFYGKMEPDETETGIRLRRVACFRGASWQAGPRGPAFWRAGLAMRPRALAGGLARWPRGPAFWPPFDVRCNHGQIRGPRKHGTRINASEAYCPF